MDGAVGSPAKKYSAEVRERAVWLFQQAETLRSWVQRAEAQAVPRRNAALAERERLKQLERVNAELTPREVLIAFFDGIEASTGSSRSARICRSSRRRITNTGAGTSSRRTCRLVFSAMVSLGSQIRLFLVIDAFSPISSMALARSADLSLVLATQRLDSAAAGSGCGRGPAGPTSRPDPGAASGTRPSPTESRGFSSRPTDRLRESRIVTCQPESPTLSSVHYATANRLWR